jgi:hypothetical protein
MAKIYPSPTEPLPLRNVTIHWNDVSVYDNRQNFNCTQIITVNLITISDKEYYAVTYDWVYDENKPEQHPFYCDQIVLLDYLTLWRSKEADSLIKYLVMDDKELAKYSGTMTAPRFRRDIIIAIALYWEENGKIKNDGAIWEHTNNYRIYLGDGNDPKGFGGHGWAVLLHS